MKFSQHLLKTFPLAALVGCSSTPSAQGGVGLGATEGTAGAATTGTGAPGPVTSMGGASASTSTTSTPGGGGDASGSLAPTGITPAGGAPTTTTTAGAASTGSVTGQAMAGASAGGAAATAGSGSLGGATATGTGGTSAGGASSAGATSNGGAEPAVTKFIGNIAPKNQDVPADFADKWMQMSMEANSKWGFVQPDSPDQWVWEPVDDAYQYAKDHDIIFKQHNFFWNFEQPSWVSSTNVAEYGPKWVQAFCERYPDVPMIDVVNEPIHNASPYRAGMGGAGESGYDWVVTAFQWAREYCPNSILIVNEFNIIEWEDDHNLFVDALQKMLDAGAPIDAIGAQGHDVFKESQGAGTEKAREYIDALWEKFHLPIYVTELDIDLSDDQAQLEMMQEEITMMWEHPNVYGITYWGFLQGSTWRTNAWLISNSGAQRPAMTWLQEFIAMHR